MEMETEIECVVIFVSIDSVWMCAGCAKNIHTD